MGAEVDIMRFATKERGENAFIEKEPAALEEQH